MPYNSKALGIVVSRIRTERGITQECFSAFAGISRSHLTMIENGRKTVRLSTFWRIAEALGLRPTELMRQVEAEAAADRAGG